MTKSQGACAGPGGDTGARRPSAWPGSQGALRGSPPPCIRVRPDDFRGAFQLQLQQRRGRGRPLTVLVLVLPCRVLRLL